MSNSQFPTRQRGYTLIEMLVAIVIFALISSSVSFAMYAGIKGREAIRSKAKESIEIRSLLGMMTRDIREAFASTGNPNSLFMGSVGIHPLIALTTMSHRIHPPTGDPNTALPDSDVTLVRYEFDSDTGTLSRGESAVPNRDFLQQQLGEESIIAHGVRSIQMTYQDSQGQASDSWYFDNSPDSQQNASGLDKKTELPVVVSIEIDLVRPDGRPVHASTAVSLLTPTPLPAGQKPPAATTATGSGSGSGSGSGTGGGGGTGGGSGQGSGSGGGGGGPRPGG